MTGSIEQRIPMEQAKQLTELPNTDVFYIARSQHDLGLTDLEMTETQWVNALTYRVLAETWAAEDRGENPATAPYVADTLTETYGLWPQGVMGK